METLTGSCLCGRITYTVKDAFEHFHLCHCAQCQKATGSAHASNLFIKPDYFEWLTGEQYLKRYDVPGRSISQAFCTECGSGLPYLTLSGSNMMVVPAGTLNSTPIIRPKNHIFWDERADWFKDLAAAERKAAF